MTSQSYVVWINKGGTGKTTLTFQLSAEYANEHQEDNTHVVVIDMCQHGHISDTLLKTNGTSSADSEEFKIGVIELKGNTYKKTVSGYLMARLDKHDLKAFEVKQFLTEVHKTNKRIPVNLYLLRGDVFLNDELFKAIPNDNDCEKNKYFIKDFIQVLSENNPPSQYVFFIDAESPFSIYTHMAFKAAERWIVPFTADEFSLSALGVPTSKAKGHMLHVSVTNILGTDISKCYLFVFNRVTTHKGKPAAEFAAIRKRLEEALLNPNCVDKSRFSRPLPESAVCLEKYIFDVRDFHSEAIRSLLVGCPISRNLYVVGDHRLKYCDDIEKICKNLKA